MKLKRIIQKIRWFFEAKQRKRLNKKLNKKYPFLHSADYDDDWCALNQLPRGWRKAFGIQMCEDISHKCKELGMDPSEVSINYMKEKWGSLQIEWSGPEDLQDIIDYYEDLSLLYCINCGKITSKVTQGWINYICEDCAKKFNKKCDPITRDCIPIRTMYLPNGSVTKVSKVPFEKYWKFEDENGK